MWSFWVGCVLVSTSLTLNGIGKYVDARLPPPPKWTVWMKWLRGRGVGLGWCCHLPLFWAETVWSQFLFKCRTTASKPHWIIHPLHSFYAQRHRFYSFCPPSHPHPPPPPNPIPTLWSFLPSNLGRAHPHLQPHLKKYRTRSAKTFVKKYCTRSAKTFVFMRWVRAGRWVGVMDQIWTPRETENEQLFPLQANQLWANPSFNHHHHHHQQQHHHILYHHHHDNHHQHHILTIFIIKETGRDFK